MGRLARRVHVMEHLPWVDPALANSLSTDATPVGPTSGPPHRLTIYVPVSPLWTIASFGAEHATRDFGWGLFFRTREHIHWEMDHSYIMLGGPSSTIAWGEDTVPGSSQGYALVTKHDAYHHADKQHLLFAKTGDMIVRTKADKAAVLQSDSGITEVNSGGQLRVNGGNNVWLTSYAGYTAATNTYSLDNGTPWPTTSVDAGMTAYAAKVAKAGSIAKTSIALLGALGGGMVSAIDGSLGTVTEVAASWGKAALNAGKIAAAVSGFFKASESIKGSSDGGLGVWGNRNATLYGAISGGIGSLGHSLLGAVTADVKGYATTGMWGGKQAAISADTGTCVVASHAHKAVVSAKDSASFVADEALVITSDLGDATLRGGRAAAVYSGTKVFVGSRRGGDGYGMVADGSQIDIGKLATSTPFGAATVARNHGIYLDANRILMVWKDAKIAAAKDHAMLRFKKAGIKLHDGGLTATAKNIHIDA